MHFVTYVLLDGALQTDELRPALDRVLEPYSESLDVAPYIDEVLDPAETRASWAKSKAEGNSWAQGDIPDDDFAMMRYWHSGEDLRHSLDHSGMFERWTTWNPDSFWDWWVVGGRWGGAFHLIDGAEHEGLATDASSFGLAAEAHNERRYDCARLDAIASESITGCMHLIDLEGKHTHRENPWGSDEAQREAWTRSVLSHLAFVKQRDPKTWLVNIDAHV